MYKDTIKFLNSDDLYKIQLSCLDENHVKIIFDNNIPNDEILLSGFCVLNEYTHENQSADYYYGYTTIYKEINEKTMVLSNDNSVYVEPESPKPYVPTEEELQLQFETAKQSKINELSSVCQSIIYKGVDVCGKHYAYTLQDQKNLENAINIASHTLLEVPYHADGESCSLYSLEKLQEIYVSEQINLTKHITYFNQMRQYIVDTFVDRTMIDDLQSIVYGTELTGSYLDTYNTIMEQSMIIMNALGDA